MTRIAIFGATGSLGSHVARLAVAAGHDVSALVRLPAKLPQDIASKATITTGDLMQQQPPQLGEFISGHDVLVSCAGLTKHTLVRVCSISIPRDGVASTCRRCATRTGRIGSTSNAFSGPPSSGGCSAPGRWWINQPSESFDCACRSNTCPWPCLRWRSGCPIRWCCHSSRRASHR